MTIRAAFLWLSLPLLVYPAALAAAEPDPAGRWVGPMKTLQGRCPTEAPSTLLVSRKRLSFVPGDGVLVLHGGRQPGASSLHAQLVLNGPDRHPVPMVFEGHAAGDAVTGIYGTPGCRAEVVLRRSGGS